MLIDNDCCGCWGDGDGYGNGDGYRSGSGWGGGGTAEVLLRIQRQVNQSMLWPTFKKGKPKK